MPRSSRLLAIVAASTLAGLTLSGCVTATTAQGVDPEMADIARNVMADMCVITKTKGSSSSSKDVAINEIYVSHIKASPNGGTDASVSYRGLSTNVYFDVDRAVASCGYKRNGPYPSPYLKARLADQGRTPTAANDEFRPIAVTWEGYTDLFSGVIHEIGDGSSGTVTITLPNNDGHCTGGYKATSRTKGTWNISCSNGLEAEGTFTAFGDGKGSAGEGVDIQGRRVSYTVGGRV